VWYRSARLFRQSGPGGDPGGDPGDGRGDGRGDGAGDWWGVFARMAEELRRNGCPGTGQTSPKGRPHAPAPVPLAPVSVGELVDKIGILELKAQHFVPGPKRQNVERELAALREARERVVPTGSGAGAAVIPIEAALAAVNRRLWDAEEALRDHEARQDFGEAFIALARSIYLTNDERAALKARINDIVGSDLREEKSYGSRPA
jgi:hypothetical protein